MTFGVPRERIRAGAVRMLLERFNSKEIKKTVSDFWDGFFCGVEFTMVLYRFFVSLRYGYTFDIWRATRKDSRGSGEIVHAFPNPTQSTVQINTEGVDLTICKWHLMDETDKILQEGKVDQSTFSIDLSFYPVGVYYFVFFSGNKPDVVIQIIRV